MQPSTDALVFIVDDDAGVRELMTHTPFRGRQPVFIGDDVTDETVFAIMPELQGLAYAVARDSEFVSGRFQEPCEVREWLRGLVD